MDNLVEYMNEKININRWLIMRVFLAGMFAGAVLGVFFGISGLVL